MPLTLATFMLENFDPAWLWGAVVVVSLACVVFTYMGIYQRSGRRLTWLLMGLRAAGVIGLLVAIIKPAWINQTRIEHRPAVAVIVDDSLSMSLPHEGGKPESRYQRAQHWLGESAAAKSLRDKFEIKWFGIDGHMLDNGPPSEPQADATDLVRALNATAAKLRGQGVKAVALISDGQDTTARPSFMTLQEFPLPVYTIGFTRRASDSDKSLDLALASVDAPPRVRVHNTVAVKLLVSKDGGGAMKVPLVIERAGKALHTEPLDLPAGSAQKPFTISFTPTEPGDFVFTARLEPQAGERTVANNMLPFRLRVEAEPIRVLLIEGTLRSEFTFLRDRLHEDPDIDLATLVRAANPETASASAALLGGELVSAERLKKIDVVMLGDFESRMLEGDSYKALRAWVDGGGGVMVLGGYSNLSTDGLWQTPLGEMLPVDKLETPQQIEQPFQFKLTPEGLTHPAMFITGNSVEDTALWQSLPELAGVVAVGKAKAGATVLARHPSPVPGSSDSVGAVVLATQPFGKGRVALLTADTTWKWSRIPRLEGRPDTLYVRFWAQMVRWLAGRDTQTQATPLTVTTDSPSYAKGDKAVISVARNPAAVIPGHTAGDLAMVLAVRSPDGSITPVKAGVSTADPNRWTATYFPDRAGRFEVQAKLSAAGTDVANQSSEFVVRGSSLEIDNPSTDPATLAAISRMTGGAYADIDDEQAQAHWLENLPTAPRVTYEVKTTHLWNNPLVLVIFIGLITAEWIVRRRNQLV
jgi:uncharacterized membrane protein